MRKKKETALNLMKKQRRMARLSSKQQKLKTEREIKSIELIEHWVNFSLEEASKNPDVFHTEESITLMTNIEKHPDFIELIQKLESNGFDIKTAFGCGSKNRPILTIIISWEHHLKQANEALSTEPEIPPVTDVINTPIIEQ